MRRAGLLLSGLVCVSCMTGAPRVGDNRSGGSDREGLVADSVTIALWHFDETAGTRIADGGPFRLDGVAGADTRTDFGRFDSARLFTRTLDSFVLVPHNPVLERPKGFTIEAWVYVNAYGQYEDTPIAARWSQDANQQSWLFGIVGERKTPPLARLPSPGFHNELVLRGGLGLLLFAYQPEDASAPRSFVSARRVERERWTHVAATFDGEVVKFYINGQIDSQYATQGGIRPSPAPILMGNYFDPRRLSSFGGDLKIDVGGDPNPYYAYEGFIDEMRISATARTDFVPLR
ncbi:MAG TPA: LamG domain-containing protein [Candidatus Limnocylindria bacterium]|nr:LamG domain-containing protein [Candidatus Limnocylindria bacterium]